MFLYGCDSLGAISGMGCLVVVFVCNERYSHRATGSVRKGFDILPHSSKLR